MAQRRYRPKHIPYAQDQKEILAAVQCQLLSVFGVPIGSNETILNQIVDSIQTLHTAAFGGKKYEFVSELGKVHRVNLEVAERLLFGLNLIAINPNTQTSTLMGLYNQVVGRVGEYVLPALKGCQTMLGILDEMEEDANNPSFRSPYLEAIRASRIKIGELKHHVIQVATALDKIFHMIDEGALFYPTPLQLATVDGNINTSTDPESATENKKKDVSPMPHFLNPNVLARISTIIGVVTDNNTS